MIQNTSHCSAVAGRCGRVKFVLQMLAQSAKSFLFCFKLRGAGARELEMEMGDGDGDGWVGVGTIVALWANVVYTQIIVCRSIDCLCDNRNSPDP